eukprot:GHVP01061430.1.p1 GENE.GHVP01061430.1~~GHVP01061430.1.p1  ORF type:complete len:146 (+),score=21.85 GHVP01061430.1:28-465(+)
MQRIVLYLSSVISIIIHKKIELESGPKLQTVNSFIAIPVPSSYGKIDYEKIKEFCDKEFILQHLHSQFNLTISCNVPLAKESSYEISINDEDCQTVCQIPCEDGAEPPCKMDLLSIPDFNTIIDNNLKTTDVHLIRLHFATKAPG